MSYACPKCGRISYHPVDEVEGYCGACHAYTRLPAVLLEEKAREVVRKQVATLEAAATVAFQIGDRKLANELYAAISKLAISKLAASPDSVEMFLNSDMRLIGSKASLSKLLWDSRELVSMFGDVVDSRIPGDSTWAKRLVKEIDAFRSAQGWSPDGFGGE